MDIQQACPNCGTPYRIGQMYCINCGANVSQPQFTAPAYYAPPPKAQANGMIVCLGIGCAVLLVIGLVGMLAAIALPNFIQVKDKAKEAECKQNLHEIQLAVERFATDSKGDYPAYLVGGSVERADKIDPSTADGFADISQPADVSQVSDQLLREQYIGKYPQNPFTRNGLAIHQLQESLDGVHEDALRNGTSDPNYGTRFGPDCTLEGNVLADPRYVKWDSKSGKAGQSGNMPTYADVEYRFWDMWKSDKPDPFLPGQFFYKSAGALAAKDDVPSQSGPVCPKDATLYMLGAYGGIREKGKDILGEETAAAGGTLWPWTRSQLSDGKNGSPYSATSSAPDPTFWKHDHDQWLYGNPNGVRDGLIIVLTAGE